LPKFVALITGMLLAVMVYFNGQLSEASSPAISNAIFQGIGLVVFTIALILQKKSLKMHYFTFPFLIPGILSCFTVLISNTVVTVLGVSTMIGLSLFGQVSASLIIDQLGLLGKPKNPVNKSQLTGLVFIAVGLILML